MNSVVIMSQKFIFISIVLLKCIISFGQQYIPESNYIKGDEFYLTPNPKSFQTDTLWLNSISILQQNNYTKEWDENTINKTEYTYDNNGNMTTYTYYTKNKTSNWISYGYKYEFVYNSNNNLSKKIEYEWDLDLTDYKPKNKETYFYNDNNKMSQINISTWIEYYKKWHNYRKDEYYYNTLGKISQKISFSSNQVDSPWEESSKNDYNYDFDGNLTQLIGYKWNTDEKYWELNGKTENSYDNANNKIHSLLYTWNTTDSIWISSDFEYKSEYDIYGNIIQFISIGRNKYEIEYDTNKNITTFILYKWDKNDNEWVGLNKSEFIYDLDSGLSNIILTEKYWYPQLYFMPKNNDLFSNKPLESLLYQWDDNKGEWVISQKSIFEYSNNKISSIEEINTELISIYPNPVFQNLNFRVTGNYKQITFKLFDARGRLLMIKEIQSSESINMQNIENGLYIYNIVYNNKRQNGILIKN